MVILFQLLTQTGIMGGVNSGLVTLSSYFPYENAHLFTMLQIVPLIFLAGTFLGKERNLVQGTPALKESGGITFGLYRLLRESSNTKM